MASYILRNVDPTLWHQVKIKAAIDQVSVKAIIEQLLAAWVRDGGGPPATRPVPLTSDIV